MNVSYNDKKDRMSLIDGFLKMWYVILEKRIK